MISIKNLKNYSVFERKHYVSIKVVYMCSSLLQLAPGSHDLFQAKKRIIYRTCAERWIFSLFGAKKNYKGDMMNFLVRTLQYFLKILDFGSAPENMKKLPSKVSHNWPKFSFLFHKILTPMTLLICKAEKITK